MLAARGRVRVTRRPNACPQSPGLGIPAALAGGGRGGYGQARRNRASALPEAILVRSAALGMESTNFSIAVASGRWKG
jgi:hypothetical protein